MENWRPEIDPTFRKGQCEFYTWPIQPHAILEFQEETLHEHNADTKTYLFREYLPEHTAQIARGRQIVDRLRQIDPSAAELFETKPYLIDGMTLRLINGETTAPPKSYSALSYCWPPDNGSFQTSAGNRPVPISTLLYQHLILQRETDDEGVWCDQLCIDQSNKAEKAATISAMDALYSCARIVVVALEDIEVSPEEQAFLEAFIEDYVDDKWPPLPPPHVMERPPIMEKYPVLQGFFTKVCRSRWFERAWCSHEMRLAKRHRFLIRCSSNPQTLLSFSDIFMSYLCLLSAPISMPDDAKLVRTTIDRVFYFNDYLAELRRVLRDEPKPSSSNDEQIQAYTTHISEIFSLGASGDPDSGDRARDANLDRITILLNTVGTGLALRRTQAAQSNYTVTTEQCQRLLFTLALAAGDPTALCTNGKPYKFGTGTSSWLRTPHATDIGSGASRQEKLPRMADYNVELDLSELSESVSLDMVVPGGLRSPNPDKKEFAILIVTACVKAGLGGGFLGQMAQGPEYLGWRMETDLDFWFDNFTGVVAVILEFGPEWMLGIADKCGFADPNVLDPIKQVVRQHFHDGFDIGYLMSLRWLDSESSLAAVNAIMRITYWMIGWSLSTMHQTDAEARAAWHPFICDFGCGQQTMIISPNEMKPAIPISLFRSDYARLPRVWLLRTKTQESGDKNSEQKEDVFFLEGKSVLFAVMPEGEYNEALKACATSYIKVFGPD